MDAPATNSGPHHCYGCMNNATNAPLPPSQSHPVKVIFCPDASDPSLRDVAVNKDGVPGVALIEISESPLDVNEMVNSVASCESCGAISTFLGVTRNHYKGQVVARLEYEAYTSMAVKQMTHIAKYIFKNFDQVHRVVIAHRIGSVPVKETSVFIAVSTEHRASGLQAVAYAIDTLKAKVPIWKREYYAEEAESGAWKRNPEALSNNSS